MATAFENAKTLLQREPRTWVITGVAGFIGSNLLEHLLRLEQKVVGIDNFSSGKKNNLVEVQLSVRSEQWKRFTFIQGDISDYSTCCDLCRCGSVVLHQVPATLGAGGQSAAETRANGMLNLFRAASEYGKPRVVYATGCTSRSEFAKTVGAKGFACAPPSGAAGVADYLSELYADLYCRVYGLETIGLRYFNVFGPRQDAGESCAGLIPHWVGCMLRGEQVLISDSMRTSRDLCYVQDVVEVNIVAGVITDHEALNRVYNIGLDQRTSLLELYEKLQSRLLNYSEIVRDARPLLKQPGEDPRLQLQADTTIARKLLGYAPRFSIDDGLDAAVDWYVRNVS